MSPTTMLFVPADRPERFEKAARAGAAAVILDLEDAVASDRKSAARANIVECSLDPSRTFVRVNSPSSKDWQADLAAVARSRLSRVMVPKAERVSDILSVHAAIGPEAIVVPLIETALGIHQLRDLLALEMVPFVAFGSLDYALDLGCEHTVEALAFARHELVFRSRLAGKSAPIDGVTPVIDDSDQLRAEANRSRHFGFGGKLVIHPKQVETVYKAFRPSDADIAWARKIIGSVSDAGDGAISVDGQMVDRPVIARAERILSWTGADLS